MLAQCSKVQMEERAEGEPEQVDQMQQQGRQVADQGAGFQRQQQLDSLVAQEELPLELGCLEAVVQQEQSPQTAGLAQM